MTLLVAFGTPGNMSSWAIAALHAIAQEAYPDHCFFAIETLPDLKNAWSNRTSNNVIIYSQHPDAELCTFLLQSKASYLVFSEDTLDSVVYLSQHLRRQDTSIIQAVSASIACISQMKSHPRLVLIERRQISSTPVHLILGLICRKMGIKLTGPAILRCIKQLVTSYGKAVTHINQIPTFEESAAEINHFYSAPGAGREDMSKSMREMAEKVLKPFDNKILERGAPSLTWPQESFLLADKGGEPSEGEIELVGRARCLIYGPYFHLPSGEWNAKFSLGIEHNVYGQIFTIEVHSDGLLSKIRVKPSGTGSFAAEAAFHIDNPKTPIEIRLFTDSGSIEGSIAYWSVELSPIDLSTPDSEHATDVALEHDQDAIATSKETVNYPE